MIRLPELDVLAPGSIAELVATVRHSNGDTKILAGGTDLIPNLKYGLHAPQRLVWLGRMKELHRISADPQGGLTIGAMCTLAEIVASPDVRRWYPSLAEAAKSVASPAIRNRATLGGNLCLDTRCYYYNESEFWRIALGGCLKLKVNGGDGGDMCHAAPGRSVCSAVFSSDTAPLLVALHASVRLVGATGERAMALAEFYTNDGVHHLGLTPGEILAEIILPPPPPGLRAAHRKVRQRTSIDYPLVNAGIALQMGSDHVLHNVRIIIGAVASAPLRMRDAELVLEEKPATADRIEEAAEKVAASVAPLPNIGETVNYRRRMVKVLVRKALAELTGCMPLIVR
jgi:4-hydroxybenzoyl-CoA reductase subunit beta